MTSFITTRSFKAASDVNVCRFLKLNTSDGFACDQASAASDTIVGVSGQSDFYPPGVPGSTAGLHAPTGQSVRVHGPLEEAVLELGTGGATLGQRLTSDANGKGVGITATAGKTIAAIALEAGVAGDRIRVWLMPPTVVTA